MSGVMRGIASAPVLPDADLGLHQMTPREEM